MCADLLGLCVLVSSMFLMAPVLWFTDLMSFLPAADKLVLCNFYTNSD